MSAGGSAAARIRDFASLVKLSHSVFALPFAMLSLLAATGGAPQWRTVGLVVVAVVAARTAAMAYNRVADRDIDARNPRTSGREIPRGAIRPGAALLLVAAAAAVFLFACWLLAPVCLWLGLPTLAWLLAYSHLKRYSALCHLWLGVALGISPVAAWVAAAGELSSRTFVAALLGLGVALWVAGFDILYSCQDEAFDRAHGLHSIPAKLGARAAMWVSRASHLLALGCFSAFGLAVPLGLTYQAGVALAAVMLVWQHRLLRPDDLSRIHTAFFTANGTIAIGMFVAGALDLLVFSRS